MNLDQVRYSSAVDNRKARRVREAQARKRHTLIRRAVKIFQDRFGKEPRSREETLSLASKLAKEKKISAQEAEAFWYYVSFLEAKAKGDV